MPTGNDFRSSILRYLCPTKTSSFKNFWWRHFMWFQKFPSQSKILAAPINWRAPEKLLWRIVFFGEHLRLCPWSLALSIPVLGLERVYPRQGCPWPWPRIFFVSLASSLVSSTPTLVLHALSTAYRNVGKKVFCPTSWANILDLIYIPGDNNWNFPRTLVLPFCQYCDRSFSSFYGKLANINSNSSQ